MLNKRFGIIGLIIFLSLAVCFAGCRRHSTPEEKMDRIITYLTDDLNLTAEQNEILDRLKKDVSNRIIEIKSSRDILKNEILIQLKSDSMDQEKIREAVSGVRSEFDELIPLMISTLAEFHKTLTIEQKTSLVKKLEDLEKLHCGK